jgi:3-hydroxybutyryl-CoA dehydratase
MIEKPNEYRFTDIKLGQRVNFTVKITESTVNNFAKISGDYSPLHMDEVYAKTTQFGKRVCHGILLASFFSRLVGMYMPGKNALYFSQTLNFASPCFIDEEIIVEGEVLDKSDATRIITMKTTIHNQAGKCLVDGIAKVIVRV